MIRQYPLGIAFFIFLIFRKKCRKKRNVAERGGEIKMIWTVLLELNQRGSSPPPTALFPRSLALSLSSYRHSSPSVKKRSVCKFTSWEQQELWKELSADVAEWKGQGKEKKEAANPTRGSNLFSFSLFPSSFVRADGHTGKGFDYENTDMQTDVSIASAYTHILYTNEPREARPPPPPITVGHMCKECVVLIYLLCSVC